jgi:hypothetical protein
MAEEKGGSVVVVFSNEGRWVEKRGTVGRWVKLPSGWEGGDTTME